MTSPLSVAVIYWTKDSFVVKSVPNLFLGPLGTKLSTYQHAFPQLKCATRNSGEGGVYTNHCNYIAKSIV